MVKKMTEEKEKKEKKEKKVKIICFSCKGKITNFKFFIKEDEKNFCCRWCFNNR